jgi:hypothetical protein
LRWLQIVFPLFPRLPKEIRLQVWEYLLPGPRIVYLQRHLLKPSLNPSSDNDPQYPSSGRASDDDEIETEINSSSRFANLFEEASLNPRSTSQLSSLHSPSPPPTPLLFVNHETHTFAITFYSKIFSLPHALPETWLDFTTDTLYLD